MVIQHLSTRLIKPNFCFHLPHRRSTTVSLETRNPFMTLHSIDFVYCSPFPGGFTYFQNCSSGETDCHARLSSPLISSGAKWKCLQFWYYTAYAGQLKVLLVPEETTSDSLKTYNCCRSNGWRLRRVPLSANFAYKVFIINKSLSCFLL